MATGVNRWLKIFTGNWVNSHAFRMKVGGYSAIAFTLSVETRTKIINFNDFPLIYYLTEW